MKMSSELIANRLQAAADELKALQSSNEEEIRRHPALALLANLDAELADLEQKMERARELTVRLSALACVCPEIGQPEAYLGHRILVKPALAARLARVEALPEHVEMPVLIYQA